MNCKCYRLTFPIIAAMIVIAMLFVVLPAGSSDGVPEDPITRSGYFDPNGGIAQYKEGGEYLEGNYGFTNKSSVYIPGYMFTADGVDYVYSKVGYAFLGWAKTPAGHVEYLDSQEITFSGSAFEQMTLYAVWDKPAGGGSDHLVLIGSVIIIVAVLGCMVAAVSMRR